MNLWTMAPGAAFLDTLAEWWLDRAGGDPMRCADGLFLLPTRRAARALADAFVARSNGRATLLPRIAAVGAPDEAPLALTGALQVPPAIDPVQRVAQLARLVLAWNGANGAPTGIDAAWRLGEELASLIDEAHRAEVDLAANLPRAVKEDFAEHWGKVLKFLEIVTAHWPDMLAGMNRIDPAARQVRLLHAQAAVWADTPPGTEVVAAGITGGIPAVARLLRVVAGAPWGRVILPGLDLAMPEPAWDALSDNHPQGGFKTLLIRLGATRGDVQPWPAADRVAPRVAPGRAALLNLALRPGAALGEWRDGLPDALPPGLSRMEPADQQEEAIAVALALRDALGEPGARTVLVTPDRALAGRVAAQLARLGVIADDSAGEDLADTPPAVFLRLLARTVADGLGPVSLLSLLKHPLAGLGLAPAECRRQARWLERKWLRGPAPGAGLRGLRERIGESALLDRLEGRLLPLMTVASAGEMSPGDALAALLIAAEALAETDTETGAAVLWRMEEGEALAARVSALMDALGVLPPQPVRTLPGLLDAALSGIPVRTRRALRGRDATEEHPRVAILGLLEARLVTADLVVLGGLTENTWPPATDPGPWMSRPMREAVGLPSPEERVGQAAHDFVMSCCAAPRVVLSSPRRRDGAPAVPARWLLRTDALLAGARLRLPSHPAVQWARRLDQPDEVAAVRPPLPCPPPERRPRGLSVTEVGTWQRDPYAIYAKHVLGLRALDELEQGTDHADYGEIVHAALAGFAEQAGTSFPPDAAERLRAGMDAALDAQPIRAALRAWWRPRLHRIADWVAAAERDRRQTPPRAVRTEQKGSWALEADGVPFTLSGRADRIDVLADGTVAILDYKTGVVPSAGQLESGLEPQLTLEAAMVEAGAFGAMPGVGADPPFKLEYWQLSGGVKPGVGHPLFKGDAGRTAEQVDAARRGLMRLVVRFSDPATPYLSCPDPNAAPRFSDYTQLARVAEWADSGESPV